MRQKILQVTVRGPNDDQLRKTLLHLLRGFELPRYIDQRILRRLISIRRRIQRWPLNVRTVVRTTRREIHELNAQFFQQTQEAQRLGKIRSSRIALINSESPTIRNQIPIFHGNSGPKLSGRGKRRIGPVRDGVKRGKPHGNTQSWGGRTDPLHYFLQKSRAIFEVSTILP